MAFGDFPLQHAVAEDAPNRCQAITPRGQCIQGALPGAQNCAIHGGVHHIKKTEQAALTRYRETIWAERAAEHNTGDIKDLRPELALLRVLLEERLRICQTPTDLLIHSNAIADLVAKLDKLVQSIHKFDVSTDKLLDKTQLSTLAEQLIAIINEEISDEEAKIRIAKRFATLVAPTPATADLTPKTPLTVEAFADDPEDEE